MNREARTHKSDVAERILASATRLFASYGYNGVSTRDIAARAGVNEVTIYRHFPRKRDLYLAVLDSELRQVKLGGDLLARIAQASDAKMVLARTFELISATMLDRPELVRLIQYSALELSEDIDPLLRKHLGELIEVVVRYLEPWQIRGELRCGSAKAVVLSFIGIIFSHRSLDRLFLCDGAGPEALFEALRDSTALLRSDF